MFGSSKKTSSDDQQPTLKFDIRTMESDMRTPFQNRSFEVFADSSQKDSSIETKSSPEETASENPARQMTSGIASGPPIQSAPFSMNAPSPLQTPPIARKSPMNKPFSEDDYVFAQKKSSLDINKSPFESKPANLPIMPSTESQPEDAGAIDPFADPEEYGPSGEREEDLLDREKERANWPIFTLALLALIVTLAAGAYYYFFVTKKTASSSAEIIPPVQETALLEEEPLPEKDIPLIAAEQLKVQSDLATDLRAYIGTLKSDPTKNELLRKGFFIRPIDAGGDFLITEQILSGIGIAGDTLEPFLSDEAWLFIVRQSEIENSPLKVSLVLLASDEIDKEELSSGLSRLESNYPSLMSPLFIDEGRPDAATLANIAFSTNVTDQRIRFYNYQPGNDTYSIDWGWSEMTGGTFVFFATSKDSGKLLLTALESAVSAPGISQ